jgi:hypothetical protein
VDVTVEGGWGMAQLQQPRAIEVQHSVSFGPLPVSHSDSLQPYNVRQKLTHLTHHCPTYFGYQRIRQHPIWMYRPKGIVFNLLRQCG